MPFTDTCAYILAFFSPSSSSSSSYFALKHRSMVGTVYVLSKNKIKIYKIQVKIFIFTSEKAVYRIGVFLYKTCI